MQSFTVKQKALFDCLDQAEKDINATFLHQSGLGLNVIHIIKSSNSTASKSDKSLAKFQDKESIFKAPLKPISKCLPDYKVNPHKWKKYSLSDVDISEQTNRSAAFDFLKQVANEQEQQQQLVPVVEEKITFNKINKTKRRFVKPIKSHLDSDSEKPVLKGSKLIMPEYEIGRSLKSHKKRKTLAKKEELQGRKLITCLYHLLEDENESNDI